MSDLSSLAETLLDYAISVAKRYEAETVSKHHIVAAVRRWREEKFDSEFPGSGDLVERILEDQRGSHVGKPIVGDDILVELGKVTRESDVWSMTNHLLSGIDDVPRSEKLEGSQLSPREVASEPPRQSRENEPLPLLLNRNLVERIASETGQSIEEIADAVFHDACAVARRISSTTLARAAQQIAESLEVNPIPELAERALSDRVAQIASNEALSSGRLATQLALALVDVGEWTAALDDEVTKDEIDEIDEIRLELRAQLGGRVDAESDALRDFEEKFSHLVGMQSVKDDLRKRVDFLVVNQRRAKRGRKVEPQRLHMAFLGNPGTGKTTVARLYGELLRQIGLLPSDAFVETDRSGLVAEYVGQSEKKTLDVINSADGGVLFIDEAYALDDRYGDDRKGFGVEVTDVLVKQMEDRRDRLVVIVAGYSKPMESFLATNLGLRSRIPVHITFPDYSDSELVEIARRIADRRGLVLNPASLDKIGEVVGAERRRDGFGNAREVENLLDAAQRNVIARVSTLGNLATTEESNTILPEDIPQATESAVKRPIGFSRGSYV